LGHIFNLPPLPTKDDTMLFYVFSGEVETSSGIKISKGESILMKKNLIHSQQSKVQSWQYLSQMKRLIITTRECIVAINVDRI